MRVTSPHDCVFMNEKNPRVSNRGERGWRRRPTPRPGSGPAGLAQPPGERRPERPLRSRSASPPAGRPGEGGGGVRHRLEASLPPPKAGIGTGTRARENGTGGPAGRARGRPLFLSNSRPPPWREPPPLLRLRRRIPGPDCISFQPSGSTFPTAPLQPLIPLGALSAPSRAPPVPPRTLLTRSRLPNVERGCWAAARGLGPLLTLRTQGRGGTGHRRGAGTASVTFTPGLLNHGAAASHPLALRGRDPSPPEPGGARPLRRDPRRSAGRRGGTSARVPAG